jgi:predicted  nucleic acid-binding Zn-ribbon protein
VAVFEVELATSVRVNGHHCDTGIAQRVHDRAHMPQTVQLADLIQQLSVLAGRLVETTGVYEGLQTEIDRLESDVRVAGERLARDTALMDQSSSPKEILALENEVETLTRRTAELEDAELSAMEAAQQAEANLAAVTAELTRTNAERAEAEVGLREGEAELDNEIANLRKLRADIAGGLPPELLGLYEKQRERYGIGAGLYVNGVSMATGMLLSESDADAIRRAESDDVLLCPESSCILVRPIDGGTGA